MTIRANGLSDVANAIDDFTYQKRIENLINIANAYFNGNIPGAAEFLIEAKRLLKDS